MLKKFFPLIIFLLFLLPLQAGAVQNVIGVRVVKNAGDLTSYPHTYVNGILSPLEWYEKNVGTKGNPEALEVDGYPAIKDGRTIYVASTNIVAGKIFSNIYLISYNEGAEPEVLQILAQLTSNWKFNINIDDDKKALIRNDLARVIDMHEFKKLMESYKARQGKYPSLEGGTYQTNWSYSVWPSWQETLAKEVGGTLPEDPVNEFEGCVATGLDEKTCWDENQKRFVCPNKFGVYAYRSLSEGDKYEFYTNFDYTGSEGWQDVSAKPEEEAKCFKYTFVGGDKTDTDLDGITDQFDNCPNGNKFNASCQDSRKYVWVSPNELKDESCNIVLDKKTLCYQTKGADPENRSGAACDRDADGFGDACDECPLDNENDRDKDGICSGGEYKGGKIGDNDNCPLVPNSDQKDSDKDGKGDVCDYDGTCGNGIKEGYEQCDLGERNSINPCVPGYGQYCNYCDTVCREKQVYGGNCGDKIIQKSNEQCEDIGGNKIMGIDLNGSTYVIERKPEQSTSVNKQYSCTGCSWTGGFCGDSKIQENYENCEITESGILYILQGQEAYSALASGLCQVVSGGVLCTYNDRKSLPANYQGFPGFKDKSFYGCNSCNWTEGFCGDGIIQTARGEKCDDGVANNTAGHCDRKCSYQKISFETEDAWKEGDDTQIQTTLGIITREGGQTIVTLPLKIDLKYLWLADSQAGATSGIFKIDISDPLNASATRINLGSLTPSAGIVGPVTDPSRTAVDLFGNVWVAGRNSDTIAKINAETSNVELVCSTDPSWGTSAPDSGPRGVSFDINGNVWVLNPNTRSLVGLNKDNCQRVAEIALPNPSYGYGLATDSKGDLIVNMRSQRAIYKYRPGFFENSVSIQEVGRVNLPCDAYGISVDRNDDIWVGLWEGVSCGNKELCKVHFSGNSGVSTCYDVAGGASNNFGRAVAVDGNNDIWLSLTYNNQVVKFNPEKGSFNTYPTGSSPIGLTPDGKGYLWQVNHGGGAPNGNASSIYSPIVGGAGSVTRYNIDNPNDTHTYIFGGTPYTYSDMAGYMLQSVSQRSGSWSRSFDSGNSQSVWKYITFKTSQPEGTTVKFLYRLSGTKDGLAGIPWIEVNIPAGDYVVSLESAGVKKWLETKIILETLYDNVAPVIDYFEIVYE